MSRRVARAAAFRDDQANGDNNMTPVQDLFFEVLNHKQHFFLEAKENNTVLDLKKMLQGITKVAPHDQQLRKSADEGRSTWLPLEDRKTLADSGFSSQNAKAQAPATLALILPQDSNEVRIDDLSQPPPIPDSMRHENNSGDN